MSQDLKVLDPIQRLAAGVGHPGCWCGVGWRRVAALAGGSLSPAVDEVVMAELVPLLAALRSSAA